jgi:4-diphosphocytidyl-2-C-methyl-D-erythritol kinase
MTVRAYAKINLGLQILRRREDGYHDIETVFHRIGLYDLLVFERMDAGIRLTTNHPEAPEDERNLCHRAATAIFDRCGYAGGVHITLEKRIPIGAGLGGGSADAAAVLRHLPEYLGLRLPEQDRFAIASSLGSDIPYFLHGGSAHARGRGELLTYFELPLPYWILVVVPAIHVSTAWAYGAHAFNPSLPMPPLRELVEEHVDTPNEWVNRLRNDFEPVVFRAHESIMRIKEILYRTGADFALMSGSGSSVFGLFRDEAFARESADFFAKVHTTHLTPPYFRPDDV